GTAGRPKQRRLLLLLRLTVRTDGTSFATSHADNVTAEVEHRVDAERAEDAVVQRVLPLLSAGDLQGGTQHYIGYEVFFESNALWRRRRWRRATWSWPRGTGPARRSPAGPPSQRRTRPAPR